MKGVQLRWYCWWAIINGLLLGLSWDWELTFLVWLANFGIMMLAIWIDPDPYPDQV